MFDTDIEKKMECSEFEMTLVDEHNLPLKRPERSIFHINVGGQLVSNMPEPIQDVKKSIIYNF